MAPRSTRRQIPRLRRRAARVGPVIAPPTRVSGPWGDPDDSPPDEPVDQPGEWLDPDDPDGLDGLDGGAGVCEPRRPGPTTPAAAVAREIVHPIELDLTADRR